MMKIKILKKYFNSRLNDCLIRDIDVHKSGRVVINAENGNKKSFYLNAKDIGFSEDLTDYSADYILCALQDNSDIKIIK